MTQITSDASINIKTLFPLFGMRKVVEGNADVCKFKVKYLDLHQKMTLISIAFLNFDDTLPAGNIDVGSTLSDFLCTTFQEKDALLAHIIKARASS